MRINYPYFKYEWFFVKTPINVKYRLIIFFRIELVIRGYIPDGLKEFHNHNMTIK